MNFQEIKKRIKERDYIFSEHADEERTKDELTSEEIEQVIISGEVIEERLDDSRGESRLVVGKTEDGRIVHIVVGLRFGKPVIVTNYIPSKKEWISGKIRKRREGYE